VGFLGLSQFFLAFQVLAVALLHVLVDSLQAFFILGHALGEVLLSLKLLFENLIVVDLLHGLPLAGHRLLDVNDKAVSIPYALGGALLGNKGVADILAANSTQDLRHFFLFDSEL